jgi:metal-responsive CopG/Arc/MetJ family transcriptional regulator
MKTAISIPDELFASTERLAKQMGISRSRVFALAADEYVAKHDRGCITERLNELCELHSTELDPVLARIQALSIGTENW